MRLTASASLSDYTIMAAWLFRRHDGHKIGNGNEPALRPVLVDFA